MNCSSCQAQILDTFYFCPFCGKKLKDKPLSTTFLKQTGIYLFAFFFPPFGLIPAYKYLKQNSEQTRVVGSITILITVVSLIITVWSTMQFVNTFNQTLKTQLELQQNNLYP